MALSQLRLPVRLGGFGLISLTLVSPAAWYCAFAHAFNRIRGFVRSLDDLSDSIPFVHNLSECITFFSRYPFPPDSSPICSSLDDFYVNYKKKIGAGGHQRQIMSVIYHAHSDALLIKFPHNSHNRARLISLRTSYAGCWLTTPPLDPLFLLHDAHFSLASRIRLGVQLFDDIKRCVCGASLVDTPLHFLACRNLSGTRIIRHDRLVQTLARVSRLCGVTTQIEPRIDGDDKSRADGHLFFHSQTNMLDVSVIDPGSVEYIKRGQRPLGAASTAETKKINIYGDRTSGLHLLSSNILVESV